MRATLALLLLLGVLPGGAHAADSERSRIAAERRAMAERFAAEEKACVVRFAVTACVDDVRARRREALAPLREAELRLDDMERQQRAKERRQAIVKRQADAAERPAAPPQPEARVRQPLLGAPASAPVQRVPDDGRARAAAAARRVQDAQQRQEDTRAVQERIEQRQAQRDAQGKKARPLPVPPAASAAR